MNILLYFTSLSPFYKWRSLQELIPNFIIFFCPYKTFYIENSKKLFGFTVCKISNYILSISQSPLIFNKNYVAYCYLRLLSLIFLQSF